MLTPPRTKFVKKEASKIHIFFSEVKVLGDRRFLYQTDSSLLFSRSQQYETIEEVSECLLVQGWERAFGVQPPLVL